MTEATKGQIKAFYVRHGGKASEKPAVMKRFMAGVSSDDPSERERAYLSVQTDEQFREYATRCLRGISTAGMDRAALEEKILELHHGT